MFRKIYRYLIIVEIESCLFVMRMFVNVVKMGFIVKIIVIFVGEVCFCVDVWMKKVIDVVNKVVRKSVNKKDWFVYSDIENNFF